MRQSMAVAKDDRLVRILDICGDKKRGIPPIISISRASWWTGVKEGKYPKPLKLGERTTVWRMSDIQKLIERIATKK